MHDAEFGDPFEQYGRAVSLMIFVSTEVKYEGPYSTVPRGIGGPHHLSLQRAASSPWLGGLIGIGIVLLSASRLLAISLVNDLWREYRGTGPQVWLTLGETTPFLWTPGHLTSCLP
jgi:hypothetical protein